MQNIDVRQIDEFRSQVILEPLNRGFGHTLGNALRRVLLSAMPGCAPTEIVIKGVKHEYSAIEGVQEDVINILLNLKGVRFKSNNPEHSHINASIKFKGPGAIKAKDIELPNDIEVLNPEHVIAQVTQAKTVEMSLRLQMGKGYVGAGQLKEELETGHDNLEGNVIYLDASFSPVRKVTYTVENARVEQKTDFDRLVLDIETNGSILPVDAVKNAARILQEQLALFSGLAVGSEQIAKPKATSIIDGTIDDLELTVRSANALKSENIMTVKDLVSLSEEQLMSLPNLGKKSLTEVREALAHHNLQLGMVF